MARLPIHPGEILAEELRERGVSAAQLARELHVPDSRVYQLLAGKRGMTADTALRLGHWLGTGPELWLRLQKRYELAVARSNVGEEIKRTVRPRRTEPPPGAC